MSIASAIFIESIQKRQKVRTPHEKKAKAERTHWEVQVDVKYQLKPVNISFKALCTKKGKSTGQCQSSTLPNQIH